MDIIGHNPLITRKEYDESYMVNKLKTEINNIIQSYAGFFDGMSELLQNAMDAVDKRANEVSDIIETLKNTTITGIDKNHKKELEDKISCALGQRIYIKSGKNKIISWLERYKKEIWITLDLDNNQMSVTDNGVGFTEPEFLDFLSPNMTFKNNEVGKRKLRGHKGVGTTFLAYGYNYLQVGTKSNGFTSLIELKGGKDWVEGRQETIPVFEDTTLIDQKFNEIERGSTFTLKFGAANSKPVNLKWLGANTCEQWRSILLQATPLGKVIISDLNESDTYFHLTVKYNGEVEVANNLVAKYIYPHECLNEVMNMATLETASDEDKRQIRKSKIRGVYGVYDVDTLKKLIGEKEDKRISKIEGDKNRCDNKIKELEKKFNDAKNNAKVLKLERELNKKKTEKERLERDIVELRREKEERINLLTKFNVCAYGSFFYSKELFRYYNKDVLKIRENSSILKSGMRLATSGMIQGEMLPLKLNFENGYENQTHILVHLDNVSPDLGRKSFQPELTELAAYLGREILSKLKCYKNEYFHSSSKTRESTDSNLRGWITETERRLEDEENQLIMTNYFSPLSGSPVGDFYLCSTPVCEQDVVSLFNQLLGAQIIRGVRLISSSQHKQYDGLFRYYMPEIDNDELRDFFEYDEYNNPLGVVLDEMKPVKNQPIKILEYKLSFDSLLEECNNEIKNLKDIGLAVVWDLGEIDKPGKYDDYKVYNLLREEEWRKSHRKYHGITHVLYDNYSANDKIMDIICLSNLIEYLNELELEC